MIEQKISKLNGYFDKEISLCEQRSKNLLADDRADEAAHEKIKANVYGIFRTILSVAVKTGKGDPDAVRHFFFLKIQQTDAGYITFVSQRLECGNSRRSCVRVFSEAVDHPLYLVLLPHVGI